MSRLRPDEPDPTSGGVALDGHILQSRVRDILDAALKSVDPTPTISFPVDMTIAGTPDSTIVGPIRSAFLNAYWDCHARVRALGLDPADGVIAIDAAPPIPTQAPNGAPAWRIVHLVTWRKKPALTVAT